MSVNNGTIRCLFMSAPFSGIEVFMRNLKEVVDTTAEIDGQWIFLESHLPELIARVPPLSFNWALKGGLVARKRALDSEAAGNRFDTIFVNHLIPAMWLGKFRRRIPMVMSLDATPTLLEKYGKWYLGRNTKRTQFIDAFKISITRKVYHDAVLLLPWSDEVRQSLQEDYGVPPEKIRTLPPGINLKQWGKVPDRRTDRNEEVNILFVGGEFTRKGGDLLTAAAKEEIFATCRFHIVTKEKVAGCPDNVRFYHGMTPNSDELRHLYALADIFVLPTRADLAPTNSICEAMTMGLPVITTHVGGLPEIVKDGETGLIIPANDLTTLVHALRTLVESKERRIQMGLNGRHFAEEHLDLNRNAAVIINCLREATRMTERIV